MTSAKETIARLALIAAAKGVTKAVISPGSRNAPLIMALDSHPDIECLNIPDERVAGFFALGMALKSGEPVMLCCTSGSAMLNYAPAITEAYYQKIPLLILTADRPVEWIDQRAGQTMRQTDAFDNYIRASYQLMQDPSADDHLLYNDRIINEAINLANGTNPGPVHINIPLKEPLYNQKKRVDAQPRIVQSLRPTNGLSAEDERRLRAAFHSHEQIMILCGQHQPDDRWLSALTALSDMPNVIVLSEATSNLSGDKILSCIDRTIDGLDAENIGHLSPTLLISCGASLVSKKIRFLLRKLDIQEHWHVDTVDAHIDTYQALTLNVPLHIADFYQVVEGRQGDQMSAYTAAWHKRYQERRQLHLDYLSKVSFSDLMVADRLVQHVPSGSVLHMANSTSVRYVQLFDSRDDLTYQCNRGVSGIDGCTSTAAGYAYSEQDAMQVLLTGDIAFFYDSNALWHHHLKPNLRIVIINNEGGNIFRVIPGPRTTGQLEHHFEAHHKTSAEHICQAHGVEYASCHGETDLAKQIDWLLSSDHKSAVVLEVFTPRLENDQILKDYFQSLKR